jgi:hypothetical protein
MKPSPTGGGGSLITLLHLACVQGQCQKGKVQYSAQNPTENPANIHAASRVPKASICVVHHFHGLPMLCSDMAATRCGMANWADLIHFFFFSWTTNTVLRYGSDSLRDG